MTQERKGGLRPWLKVLLGLSLALNLVIVGVVLGAAWRFRDGPPAGARPPMLGGFIFKDLGRKEVQRLLQAQSGEDVLTREHRLTEMKRIIALLRQENLDAEAVKAILESHVIETHSFMLAVSQAWWQRLEGLDQAERQRLADRMERHLERKPRRRKGEGGGREDRW